MTASNLLTASAGLAMLAVLGCAAPTAVPVVERGHLIDHALLEGLQRGVTTRTEAIALFGEPSTTSTSAEDGGTTCSWDYVHSDGKGSTAIMTILKFGRDDTLQIKLVSQSRQVHP
jgi:outer membrane protein assembly factor BamE (lipoprotein component of BamABCDE complex)